MKTHQIFVFFSFLIGFIFSSNTSFSAEDFFNNYTNTTTIQATDEFLLYRPGCGTGSCMRNWQPDFFSLDADGNITGPVTLTLPNLGLRLKDTDALQNLTIKPGTNLTANRTLTFTTGDSDRTLTMGGAITTAADLITSGANSLTFTTTAATNVTLPTTGTLSSLAGTESLSNKTMTATGKISFDATNTAGGTTGAQTINKPSGTVNFAAAATTLVVTNSFVSANSIVIAVVRTADATATIKSVVPASGSFTITLGSAATAETSVGFVVFN